MTPNLKLDWLPREILREIVTLGSCETALALSKVNKRLQYFCDDPGLFKSIIENHRGHEVATWYSTTLSMESPISTWARYALADAKASQCSLVPLFVEELYVPYRYPKSQLRLDAIARFRDFASWGPQLMASYHPFVDSINTTTIYKFLRFSKWPASSEGHDVRYALTFCLMMKLLNKPTTYLDWWKYPWNASSPGVCGETEYTDRMALELQDFEPANRFGVSLSDDRDNNEVTTETRHQLLIAFGLFCEGFRLTYIESRYIKSRSHLFPRDIPFISMMGLPLPLSLNAAGDFATCHLSKTTSKEFFNDGLWIYSKSIGDIVTLATFPVHEVAFVATQTEAHPSKVTLCGCGSGSDLRGDFSLEGSIAQETGRVYLVKRYIRCILPTPDTYLSGLMTPFGVVGVQNSSEMLERGWFWLWKAAWTRERESPPHA